MGLNKKKNTGQIVIYQTEDGLTKLDVRLEDETVWLNQKMIAELFQTTIPNINMHLKSIFEEHELEEYSTIKDFLIVQDASSHSDSDFDKILKTVSQSNKKSQRNE